MINILIQILKLQLRNKEQRYPQHSVQRRNFYDVISYVFKPNETHWYICDVCNDNVLTAEVIQLPKYWDHNYRVWPKETEMEAAVQPH
jgi:hypothetical protein